MTVPASDEVLRAELDAWTDRCAALLPAELAAIWCGLPVRELRDEVQTRLAVFVALMEALHGPEVVERVVAELMLGGGA